MTIYAILGGIGSGKTLAMVYLALKDVRIRNKNILSNIKMKIPNCELIQSTMMEEMPSNLKNKTMCFDEIHNFLDSRTGSKKNNLKRTHFILQSRHAGEGSLDIIYTTQFMHQVDKRLRDNTDVKVYPYILKRNEKTNMPQYMLLSYLFYENNVQRTVNEYIMTEHLADKYDTHEIVALDI